VGKDYAIYGRFHFTCYPITSFLVRVGVGYELEDCEDHGDAYRRAFSIFSGPHVRGWKRLRDYKIELVPNNCGLKDIRISHPGLRLKIYHPSGSSQVEGVFSSNGRSGLSAMVYLFDEVAANFAVEKGDLRESCHGKIRRI